jgi:hypothetical protein
LFLAHSLEVAEWYVQLVEAERTGLIELTHFAAEPRSWRRYVAAHGNQATLKPDAVVHVLRGGWEERWFLEIDRATEHLPAVKRQLDQYVAYWRTGVEQHASDGLFPKVLWIVPDDRRYNQLIEAFGRLAPEAWPLFQVAITAKALGILTTDQPP